MPNEGANNLLMINITIITHFWSHRKMFRRHQLRPIRGRGKLKVGEANSEKNDILEFHKRKPPPPQPAHNPQIDSYSLFTDECLAVDSHSARTKCHEIICEPHVMLVCITLLLDHFPIWSIWSRSNHRITNQWVFWLFQSTTNLDFWSSAFSARGTTMEQFWMGMENSKCLI